MANTLNRLFHLSSGHRQYGRHLVAPTSLDGLTKANATEFEVEGRKIFFPKTGWSQANDGTALQAGSAGNIWTSILASSSWGCSYTWNSDFPTLHSNVMLGDVNPVRPTVEAN